MRYYPEKKIQIMISFFFKKSENLHGLREQTKKIIKQQSKLDTRKHFFSQRVVSECIKLSQKVVDPPSVNGFKNALGDEWNDMDATS
jgi:ferritin-like protein